MARKAPAGSPAKVIPFVPTTNYEKREYYLEQITDHMLRHSFSKLGGFLLSGDPGGGKTSMIKAFSKVLGIELVIIEAPHLVEEHIVNIPFITFKPSSTSEHGEGGSTKVSTEFGIKLADSNLHSKLTSAKPIPDAQLLKNIYSSPQDVIHLWESLGGDRDTIPPRVADVRKIYSVILFIDEYFRQDNVRILNMLRDILNGQLGKDKIPTYAYIIYASNMNDEGLASIPENYEFAEAELAPPSKDEWFSWFYHLYHGKNDTQGKSLLNKDVVNKFFNILEEEHLSYKDEETAIRTSPRRWEQVLLYVSSSLPVKTAEEGKNLITNVRHNFESADKRTSSLVEPVAQAVAELIKETSDIDVSATAKNDETEWRNTLYHQIQAKEKMGDHRKYIPVIAGPPGIGKTSIASQVARDLDLRLIRVDVANKNPEDIIGLPVPKEKGDNISVHFTAPALHRVIMNEIHEEDAKHIAELKATGKNDEAKEYPNKRWKYLILFDELNRADVRTFNSIRRVILEKEFGLDDDGNILRLPEEAIVIAAINPEGVGTNEMTSHMADVIDVIHSEGSWKKQRELLEHEVSTPSENKHGTNFQLTTVAKKVALNVLDQFVDKYKTIDKEYNGKTLTTDTKPFYLDLGKTVYVAPRAYTEIFGLMATGIQTQLDKYKNVDLSSAPKAVMEKFENQIRQAIYDKLASKIKFIGSKEGVSGLPETFKGWILKGGLELGEGLFTKVAGSVDRDLGGILGKHLEGKSGNTVAENQAFINYVKSMDEQVLKRHLQELFENKIKTEDDIKKYLIAHDQEAIDFNFDTEEVEKAPNLPKRSLYENFVMEIVFAMLVLFNANKAIVARNAVTESFMALDKNNKFDESMKKEITTAESLSKKVFMDWAKENKEKVANMHK